MVIVPGVNDSDRQIDAAAELLGSLQNIVRIRLLAYHLMAGSKYVALGLENTLPKVEVPGKKQLVAIGKNVALLKTGWPDYRCLTSFCIDRR